MASRNEKAGEIYPEFGDSAIWIFFFQRQFYHPDVSPHQLPHVEAVVKRCSERLNTVK